MMGVPDNYSNRYSQLGRPLTSPVLEGQEADVVRSYMNHGPEVNEASVGVVVNNRMSRQSIVGDGNGQWSTPSRRQSTFQPGAQHIPSNSDSSNGSTPVRDQDDEAIAVVGENGRHPPYSLKLRSSEASSLYATTACPTPEPGFALGKVSPLHSRKINLWPALVYSAPWLP